jgi:uncharacterized protein involved in exopolysaccharide biosynthesis
LNISEKKRAEQMVVDALHGKQPEYPVRPPVPTEAPKEVQKLHEQYKKLHEQIQEAKAALTDLDTQIRERGWKVDSYNNHRPLVFRDTYYEPPEFKEAVTKWQEASRKFKQEREQMIARVWNDDFTFATLAEELKNIAA